MNKNKLKDILIIFSLCLLLLLIDFFELLSIIIISEQKRIFYIFKILFLLIFLSILSRIFYKRNFYSHQYLAIFIIILFSFLVLLIQIKYFEWINLLLKMIISFFESISLIIIDYLMKKKYFSPYKICFIIGLINSIIVFIIYLIVSNISCEKSQFCTFEYNNQFFFDNINYLIEYSTFLKILIFITIIVSGFRKFIFNLFINNYAILHIFYYYLCEDLANFSMLFWWMDLYIIICSLVFSIFLLIGIGMFFENLKLHFCGLDNNLKNNIIERSIKENNEDDSMDNINEKGRIEIAENYYISYDDVIQEDNDLFPK